MSEKKITNSADKAADQAAEKAAAKPAAKTSSKPAAKRGRPAKSKKAEKETKEHKERKDIPSGLYYKDGFLIEIISFRGKSAVTCRELFKAQCEVFEKC